MIRMGLKEIGLEAVNWINLAQDRDKWRVIVDKIMNLWTASNWDNFLTS
jgi:hypothetical protein